jgi:hypothetical protein
MCGELYVLQLGERRRALNAQIEIQENGLICEFVARMYWTSCTYEGPLHAVLLPDSLNQFSAAVVVVDVGARRPCGVRRPLSTEHLNRHIFELV